ncbi:hypothetical protein NZ698_15695 [Chryseobacterium sp. PBS4-4]|uniref:Uncharacterized protein n=1 Tax=Chryseobacterium edaphi TaxID=2976532 RepID=A0ABT2W9I9_9FLAO|nr:hypothetical protein [Chryseobacterium edaphi]MCU7618638.1 hypothetical protein [Chryseobacterium edaphi]
MFDEIEFKNNIQSKYITEYGAEIGEVFCRIFERSLNNDILDDLFNEIEKFGFFDREKFDKKYLVETNIIESKNAMISAIIKESKYNEHFMTWEKGSEFLEKFLNQFDRIENVYQNAYWEKSTSNNSYKDELDMMGWSGISKYNYYDYGFVIISERKIGILWFGDDS